MTTQNIYAGGQEFFWARVTIKPAEGDAPVDLTALTVLTTVSPINTVPGTWTAPLAVQYPEGTVIEHPAVGSIRAKLRIDTATLPRGLTYEVTVKVSGAGEIIVRPVGRLRRVG